jgi:hypothetical protein
MLAPCWGSSCPARGSRACLRGKRRGYGRSAKPHLPIGLGWPRLEAALSLIWRWRGAPRANSPTPQGGWFPHGPRTRSLVEKEVGARLADAVLYEPAVAREQVVQRVEEARHATPSKHTIAIASIAVVNTRVEGGRSCDGKGRWAGSFGRRLPEAPCAATGVGATEAARWSAKRSQEPAEPALGGQGSELRHRRARAASSMLRHGLESNTPLSIR